MTDSTHSSFADTNNSTVIVDNLFQKILLGSLLSSLSIFTVCGNILVLYALQTEKSLRTVSNLFILSLALADLAVGLFVMPLSTANIIAGKWPFSSAICKMWLSTDYVASTASIFNLVLLSLDRYWAVVYPLRYLQKRTRRRASTFIVIVWLVSSLWAPAVIFWSHIAPHHSDIIKSHECDTSFRSNKTFKTLTALVNFYIPLLAMIVVSFRIMVTIRARSEMEFGRRLSSTAQKQMRQNRIHKRSTFHDENQSSLRASAIQQRISSLNIVTNPLDGSTSNDEPTSNMINNRNTSRNSSNTDDANANNFDNNITLLTEPGQCFCSTCHPCSDNANESLWQLQSSPIQRSYSATQYPFPFYQVQPLSTIFSSKQLRKENDTINNIDMRKSLSEYGNRKYRNSSSASNGKKFSIFYSNENAKEHLSPTLTKIQFKTPEPRTPSVGSSLSDEYSDVTIANPVENQQKSRPIQETLAEVPRTSNQLQRTSSNPKLLLTITATSTENSQTKTVVNDSLSNMPIDNTVKTNYSFLNTLIDPSRSSSLQKELKAARQLGMLVGVFTVSWLPYFILYLVVAWCTDCVPDFIFTASIWLGYVNSTFNPLIYPLCNAHFRRAFQKILYCKRQETKLTNLGALSELQSLYAKRPKRR